MAAEDALCVDISLLPSASETELLGCTVGLHLVLTSMTLRHTAPRSNILYHSMSWPESDAWISYLF